MRTTAATSLTSPDATKLLDVTSHEAHMESHESQLIPAKRMERSEGILHIFRAGGIGSSVFNLCSATLGAGALALPLAISKAGIITGFAMLLMGAMATILSIDLLVQARVKSGLPSFEDMSVGVFGQRMGILVEMNIIVFSFGTAIAYCRAVGDILDPVITLINAPQWLNQQLCMTLFWFIVMLPLSMLRTMNALRFSSLFGVITIFYLVIATMIHSLMNTQQYHFLPINEMSFWFGRSFIDVIEAAPIVIFAFTCQVNVFAIYNELEVSSPAVMEKVTHWSMFTCLVVYITIGFFGFLEFQSSTCGNILQNFRTDLNNGHVMVIGAYLGITLTILMAFPLVIFPCRYSIETILDSHSKWRLLSHPSTFRHVLVTLGISGTSLLLSLFVPNISFVFQLVGGTTSAFLGFILPGCFAFKLKLSKDSTTNVGVWGLVIGGSAVGVVSTVLTLISLFSGKQSGC
eukprot:c9047_g1_i1.p1 GENE.c9047_g1_i1~~c9047_g1_i1.p1  ORF type:complete len:461 (+),score=88.58 c9047_g1_i1:43-1425(+)